MILKRLVKIFIFSFVIIGIIFSHQLTHAQNQSIKILGLSVEGQKTADAAANRQ